MTNMSLGKDYFKQKIKNQIKKLRGVKVCFITYYGYKPFNEESKITFGGNEVLYFLMAKELSKDWRYNVNLLVEDDLHPESKKERFGKITLHKTSRDTQINDTNNDQLKEIMCAYKALSSQFPDLRKIPHLDFYRLWQMFETIDADVYIQGSAAYETGIIALLCKIFNKKFIFYVGHDIDINKEFVDKNGILGQIFEFGLTNADAIWCSSTRHQELLKKTYNLPSLYIPYWYPLQEDILPLNKREHILWVARVEKWKHPEIFLELAKTFKNEKFIIIGSFSNNEPEFFYEIEKIANLLPNVEFIKNVPLSKIDSYFQRAKIFIETSDYKNMHTSHLQSVSAGTPCLSMFGDPNNTFKQYNWGIFSENNLQQLSNNLKKVLTDQSLWNNLSKNAISYAKQNHEIKKMAEKFKNILLDLKYND